MSTLFGDFRPADHDAEAAKRWPDVYAATKQRTAQYSDVQWQEAKAEQDSIADRFTAIRAEGSAPDSLASMAIAEEHRASIERWFYPCSSEMHCGLADLYVADPRFRKYWEDRASGLAEFVHDSIYANAMR